jgi:transposase
MAEEAIEIIDLCRETRNSHFRWFANPLESHFEGIIAHATYRVSSSKAEGTSNLIKTIRRQGLWLYGYPEDDQFFLKIFDASGKSYVKNSLSPRIRD